MLCKEFDISSSLCAVRISRARAIRSFDGVVAAVDLRVRGWVAVFDVVSRQAFLQITCSRLIVAWKVSCHLMANKKGARSYHIGIGAADLLSQPQTIIPEPYGHSHAFPISSFTAIAFCTAIYGLISRELASSS